MLKRVMKELRDVQSSCHAEGPVAGCEPKGDNLLDWTCALRFPPSDLQLGLDDWARAAQLDPKLDAVVRVRVFFPSEFPFVPPEVWVRSPRLCYLSAPVTFGGKVCSAALTRSGWTPSTTALVPAASCITLLPARSFLATTMSTINQTT